MTEKYICDNSINLSFFNEPNSLFMQISTASN